MESALPDLQRDDELRYVTEHFADLQGLRMVPVCAAIVLLGALECGHVVSRRQGVELFLGLLALAGAWFVYAGRWYRGHYGLVTPREERIPSQVLSILQTDRRPHVASQWWYLWVFALLFALYFVDLLKIRSDLLSSGFGPMCAIFLLLPKARFAGGASRWVRGRQMLAVCGIAMLGVVNVGYLLGRLDRWQYLAAIGMILMLASLYDHWLLTRLLSGRFGEDRDA